MKSKIIITGYICLFFLACGGGSKLTDQQVIDAVKSKFNLTDQDTVEVNGIAEDTENSRIAKVAVNTEEITVKLMKFDTGWQLEEVKSVAGIWVSAGMITDIIGQSDKQKTAMLEISTLSSVMVDYMTDNGKVFEINGKLEEGSPFHKMMVPFYITSLPKTDPWGNEFLIFSGTAVNGKYGIKNANALDFLVVSLGADGVSEFAQDFVTTPGSGLYPMGEFNADLAMWNGSWIRAPKNDTP